MAIPKKIHCSGPEQLAAQKQTRMGIIDPAAFGFNFVGNQLVTWMTKVNAWTNKTETQFSFLVQCPAGRPHTTIPHTGCGFWVKIVRSQEGDTRFWGCMNHNHEVDSYEDGGISFFQLSLLPLLPVDQEEEKEDEKTKEEEKPVPHAQHHEPRTNPEDPVLVRWYGGSRYDLRALLDSLSIDPYGTPEDEVERWPETIMARIWSSGSPDAREGFRCVYRCGAYVGRKFPHQQVVPVKRHGGITCKLTDCTVWVRVLIHGDKIELVGQLDHNHEKESILVRQPLHRRVKFLLEEVVMESAAPGIAAPLHRTILNKVQSRINASTLTETHNVRLHIDTRDIQKALSRRRAKLAGINPSRPPLENIEKLVEDHGEECFIFQPPTTAPYKTTDDLFVIGICTDDMVAAAQQKPDYICFDMTFEVTDIKGLLLVILGVWRSKNTSMNHSRLPDKAKPIGVVFLEPSLGPETERESGAYTIELLTRLIRAHRKFLEERGVFLNAQTVTNMVIDCDARELAALRDVYPGMAILFCWWHMATAMRKKFRELIRGKTTDSNIPGARKRKQDANTIAGDIRRKLMGAFIVWRNAENFAEGERLFRAQISEIVEAHPEYLDALDEATSYIFDTWVNWSDHWSRESFRQYGLTDDFLDSNGVIESFHANLKEVLMSPIRQGRRLPRVDVLVGYILSGGFMADITAHHNRKLAREKPVSFVNRFRVYVHFGSLRTKTTALVEHLRRAGLGEASPLAEIIQALGKDVALDGPNSSCSCYSFAHSRKQGSGRACKHLQALDLLLGGGNLPETRPHSKRKVIIADLAPATRPATGTASSPRRPRRSSGPKTVATGKKEKKEKTKRAKSIHKTMRRTSKRRKQNWRARYLYGNITTNTCDGT